MGTPNSVIQPFQKIQNFAARLILLAPRHQHSTPLLEKLHWLPISEHIKSLVCVSMLILLTSVNCYMSTLCLIYYALLLTPTHWKYNNTNTRLMAFTSSLALDPTFGIYSHKTLDTAQLCHLLKPNWKPPSSHSIFAPSNISTQFLLQSLCVRVHACMRARECTCMMYDTDQCHTHLNCGFCSWGGVGGLSFDMVLCVGCLGGTVLYVCIEYHI